MSGVSRVLSWFGVFAGFCFLTLQFIITIQARLELGDNLLGALWFLLTFFTVLSNIGVLAVHISARFDWPHFAWFRRAYVRTMLAVLILIVMVVYHLVLAPLWQPKGFFAVANIGLHYITPLIYLGWWTLFRREHAASFGDIPAMLLPPVLYLIWAMARGLAIGEYPYPFLDMAELGFGRTALNSAALFLTIGLLYSLFILLEGRLPRAKSL
ncbi:hypothetical protein MXMO3_02142 [Maritalea myrionectae]|uniref:Pr6Pr family membrane protein n=1 Tax=Maritalea myrionectae TaxID=454601 RepID=A0A2R4MFB4_9HYPH|nr:Pr6Pr family membrane protein [Maritalea myrionectae]AVX04663.1 hypothetical protein MXMO3_02142 [Maritalea myrionectae]